MGRGTEGERDFVNAITPLIAGRILTGTWRQSQGHMQMAIQKNATVGGSDVFPEPVFTH